MQEAYRDGVVIVGVTSAGRDDVRAFADEYLVNYPLLADAGADVAAFGVDLIWGSTIYLVDPGGSVVVEGLDATERTLAEREPASRPEIVRTR